ncbi:DEAD-box ATP-dependent RNA helicase 40-like [Macadamia integrifolia]|uniref:DEAD-box ATP-dependent RNA helicase 40-like n=1 Tax=Macadamia integrifolia TaxID=60698 RepID=UPI001C4F79B1|nr:DEAD-box ATP-dependent RNA helicase 40-like [Macadamia integrifolia]XP_042514251.1 DEAD-box ATP-dependent RNA helicase 40-like [Macadamia integrifolia]XP_042514252.1 DEAD-box ATP-dependent RNA helicase 40-like [Macadamia integrifolia]
MATAEAASASLGPRYAPDDPTLPQPWKGLIDGSTGLLYYWNPETNITQYERPATLPPPLPPGLPPSASTPKLAPIPMARTMQGQQLTQAIQQQGQQITQVAQQPGQLLSQQQVQQFSQAQQQGPQTQQASQQPSQMVQSAQQQGQLMQQQFRQQMLQQPVQQMPQQMPQNLSQQTAQHQGQQFSHQQLQQLPYQQSSLSPGQQISPRQAQQVAHQHGSHISQQQAQPIPHQQGQQISQPQAQQIIHQHGQQFSHHQGQKMGFPKRDESDFQQGKQIAFSPSQIQNLPTGSHSIQIPQIGIQSVHAQQFGNSSGNTQTASPLVQIQQSVTDHMHRQQVRQQMGTPIENQVGPTMLHNQQSSGLKMGYEDPHGRSGNDFYFNANKEGPVMLPQQPKLSAIPMARNQQENRMDGVPPHNPNPGHPGGLNIVAGHVMPNLYNHAAGVQVFSNSATVRPPRMVGSSDVGNLSPAEVYCRQNEVTATGDNVPAPFMTFEATGFPPEILREIHLAGFSSPTPIQAQTWPIALQSRDIVAIAKTGSGKTLGYIIPAFIHLRQCRNNPQNGPTVLVLAPTRELATQIQDEVIKFGRSSRVSCTCLYGGAPKGPQLRELDRGADIVVATPGRLNDILEMKKIDFRQVSLLVLDEADRMLDMGFEPQIRKIVNEIPPRRQTLMYTATWPKEVRKIAGDLLVNPVQVNIGSVDELAANKAITQYVEVVPQMEKQRRIEQILRSQERGSKIIIFCSTKRLCDQLARSIGRNFGAAAIHGDKSQGERDWVLNQFRSGKSPILVATDVAARGLDIKDIRVVINYDFPTGIGDYVHRIGRTGRAGATGVSYTFFSDQDWKYAADLVKVLEGANQRVPPELREMAVRGGPIMGKGRGGMGRRDSGGGRFDSGGGRFDSGGGRWDSGGRGGSRDGGFSARGGRNDFFGGRGNRGRGFGGPGSGPVGWGRHEQGPRDRYDSVNGRGRYDNRRSDKFRRSYGRSRSQSRSRSPSRSWSRSRSRSRSRSWSRSLSRSRSRSRSYERYERSRGQNRDLGSKEPEYDAGPEESRLSPMSPGATQGGTILGIEPAIQLPIGDSTGSGIL